MSTRKRKSAEQAPPSKDHHSPEQVKEVALMLYRSGRSRFEAQDHGSNGIADL